MDRTAPHQTTTQRRYPHCLAVLELLGTEDFRRVRCMVWCTLLLHFFFFDS